MGRANGRPMTGSATKQSSFLIAAKLDCFPSLAMTVWLHSDLNFKQRQGYDSAFPRHAFARVLHLRLLPLGERAQGRPGADCARSAVC